MRRHLQGPGYPRFASLPDRRLTVRLRGQAPPGVQRIVPVLNPTPTGPRFGTVDRSLHAQIYAYLSCSMSLHKKTALFLCLSVPELPGWVFVVYKCEGRARVGIFRLDVLSLVPAYAPQYIRLRRAPFVNTPIEKYFQPDRLFVFCRKIKIPRDGFLSFGKRQKRHGVLFYLFPKDQFPGRGFLVFRRNTKLCRGRLLSFDERQKSDLWNFCLLPKAKNRFRLTKSLWPRCQQTPDWSL